MEEVSEESLEEYFDRFIRPFQMEAFVCGLLIPYLPEEVLEREYSDTPEVIELGRITKKQGKIAP